MVGWNILSLTPVQIIIINVLLYHLRSQRACSLFFHSILSCSPPSISCTESFLHPYLLSPFILGFLLNILISLISFFSISMFVRVFFAHLFSENVQYSPILLASLVLLPLVTYTFLHPAWIHALLFWHSDSSVLISQNNNGIVWNFHSPLFGPIISLHMSWHSMDDTTFVSLVCNLDWVNLRT